MKLAASTIASPDNSWEEICETYSKYGYEAIEIRGIKRQMYLTKVPEFSDSNLSQALKLLKKNKLKLTSLSTSVSFVGKSKEDIEKTLTEGKDHIMLANKMGAPFIRVFGGVVPKEMTIEQGITQVVENLKILGDFAKKYGVKVLLETHDNFAQSKYTAEIIKKTAHKQVGLCWDVSNSVKAGASVEESIEIFGKYVDYTHVKDSDEETYTLCGEGKIPLKKAVELLKQNKYKGYLCVEWEKLWIPALPDASVALPQYANKLKEYLG